MFLGKQGIGLKEITDLSSLSRYFDCILIETRKLVLREIAKLVYRVHSGRSGKKRPLIFTQLEGVLDEKKSEISRLFQEKSKMAMSGDKAQLT